MTPVAAPVLLLRPGPASEWGGHLALLGLLLQLTAGAAEKPGLHQVRCTVIMQTRPDRLYCYATNKPFRVFLQEPGRFAHGEVLIARGPKLLSELREAIPTLLNASVERTGETNLPPPLRVTPAQLIDPALNFHRVAVEAKVIAHEWMNFLSHHIEIVVAEAGGRSFRVNVLNYSNARERLPVGTTVEFVGLNFIEAFAEARGPEAQMDVENLEECQIIRPAPWLTLEVARRLFMAGGALAVMGGLWLVRERRQIARLRAAERTVRDLNSDLERRIQERTTELQQINGLLRGEVAARKNAEAGLRVALDAERELSQLKSRFVSMVSHEFRTPLGIILSSAEILDAYLDRLPPHERRSNLADITQASRHMAAMMEEVLLLSQVEAGKTGFRPAPLPLESFCLRLVDEVASATSGRCPIRCHVPPDLPDAHADGALLRHILINLLTNAVKYSPPGAPVDFALQASGDLAVFTVTDRGIGIVEADARQLFQAFFRGRNVGEVSGTGLGLVIVKRCVELHNGQITFESQEAQGTTFTVSLPLFGLVPINSLPS